MVKSLLQVLAVSSAAATLAACSGGSGGGSGGGSTSVASGALSVPDIKCGNSACLTSSAAFTLTAGLNSGLEVADYGATVYDHFNTVVLPKVNENLYKVETAFKELGFETCAEVAAIPDVTDHALATGYTVNVFAEALTSPFGGTTSKSFIVKYSGSPVIHMSIGCSGTVRNFYVKVLESASVRYELWAKTDSTNSNVKSIEAAADTSNGAKATLQFTSTSETDFTLGAVGKSYPNPYISGQTVDFSIYGQASLGTPKIAKIAYSGDASQAPPTAYSTADTNWLLTSIGHCYSNLDLVTVDALGTACGPLTVPAPTTSGVRGHTGAATWSVNDFSAEVPGISL